MKATGARTSATTAARTTATAKPAEFHERNVVRAATPQWDRERANMRPQNHPQAQSGGFNRERSVPSSGADFGNPAPSEHSQARRHFDRSSPTPTPESRP